MRAMSVHILIDTGDHVLKIGLNAKTNCIIQRQDKRAKRHT